MSSKQVKKYARMVRKHVQEERQAVVKDFMLYVYTRNFFVRLYYAFQVVFKLEKKDRTIVK